MSDIEWSETNEALRHRGLNPISVPPGRTAMTMQFHDAVSSSNVESDGEERPPKDVVVMEKKSLAAIQDTLHRLMADCDRRQGLITDLIKTNSSLREELTSAKERRPSSTVTDRRPSSTTPIASLLRSRHEDDQLASSTNKINSAPVGGNDKTANDESDVLKASSAIRRGSDDLVIGSNTNNNNDNRSTGSTGKLNMGRVPPTSTPTPATVFLPTVNQAQVGDDVPAVVDGGGNCDDSEGQHRGLGGPRDHIPDNVTSYGHTPVRCDSKSEQTDRELREIKRRLLDIEKEESRRRCRREAVFKQIRRRPARSKNSADNKLLDVIDVYEREIERVSSDRDDALSNSLAALNSEVDVTIMNAPGVIASRPDVRTTSRTEGKNSFRPEARMASGPEVGFLSTKENNCDRELREAESAMQKWKTEMKKMKEEIDSRPTRKDLDDAQTRISELQRLLVETEQRNSQPSRRNSRDDRFHPPQSGVDEAVLCLDKVKSRLGVQSSLDVVDKVDFLCRAQTEGRKAEKLLKKINAVIDGGEEGHKLWCQSSGVKLLQTLRKWKSDLNEIPQIHQNVDQLQKRLLGNDETIKTGRSLTKELATMTETLLKDNSLPSFDSVKKIDDANKQTMVLIISHFQTLFDVEEVPNVITRMNDVYNKMKEIQNILKTLREMLGLDNKTPAGWAVVDAVAQLTNALNASSTRRLQEVLGVGDLESVVTAVGEHRDFCPVFTRVLQKVMEVLVVDNLDQVLPAIQSLKLLATPAPLHEDDDAP